MCPLTYFSGSEPRKTENCFSQDRTAGTGSLSVVMTHSGVAYLISRSMSEGMDSGNPHHSSTVTVTMTCSHVTPIAHTHTKTLSVSHHGFQVKCLQLSSKQSITKWMDGADHQQEREYLTYLWCWQILTPLQQVCGYSNVQNSSCTAVNVARNRQYLSKSHCIMYKFLYLNYSCVYIVLNLNAVFCSMFRILGATWTYSGAKHTFTTNYVGRTFYHIPLTWYSRTDIQELLLMWIGCLKRIFVGL